MKPVNDGLRAEYGDRMVLLPLDVENEGRAAFSALNLRGHPRSAIIGTVGQLLRQNLGEQPKSRLETAIREALQED